MKSLSNVIKGYSVNYDRVELKSIDTHLKQETEMIIKGNEMKLGHPSQDKLSTEELADGILSDAREEAGRILAEAIANKEEIENEAFANATKNGYEAGFAKANEEIVKAKEQLEQEINDFDHIKIQAKQKLEPEIVNLIAGLVEKTTGIVVEDYKEVIYNLVQRALRNAEPSKEYNIKVSSYDFEYIESRKDELLASFTRDEVIHIIEDPTLSENQCFIEMDFNFSDCSLETQLSNLITNLKLLGRIQ